MHIGKSILKFFIANGRVFKLKVKLKWFHHVLLFVLWFLSFPPRFSSVNAFGCSSDVCVCVVTLGSSSYTLTAASLSLLHILSSLKHAASVKLLHVSIRANHHKVKMGKVNVCLKYAFIFFNGLFSVSRRTFLFLCHFNKFNIFCFEQNKKKYLDICLYHSLKN